MKITIDPDDVIKSCKRILIARLANMLWRHQWPGNPEDWDKLHRKFHTAAYGNGARLNGK